MYINRLCLRNRCVPCQVLALSHVLTTTGYTLPLEKIVNVAHDLGVAVVVDGAQALSIPMNIPSLGADVYAAPGTNSLVVRRA
jgi:selenocysteine lyase/cysteine desulfurase